MAGVSSIPHWLEFLLREKFFYPCVIHEFAKKNEKNIFCLDCCTSICPHCMLSHSPHRLLQIRRYVYNSVIRLSDAQQLMNCSLVQSYTTNSAKVVFLNPRPILSHPIRGSGKFCITCDRRLQDPYSFCSVSCKVHHQQVVTNGENCHEFAQIALPEYRARSECVSEIEEHGQMTHDSALEEEARSTSASSSSSSGGVSAASCKTVACRELVKKKRCNLKSVHQDSDRPRCSPSKEISVALNRRKGVPRRSPLN
ncbi:hypothetical protein I3843_12G105900 [Carya illinoinensis]|nr:hypothetical protein I3843_12G105900 [Carya illinoinensis]